MKKSEKTLQGEKINLRKSAVLARLGYKKGMEISEPAENILDTELQRAKSLIDLKFVSKVAAIKKIKEDVVKLQGFEIKSADIAKLLSGSKKAAIFAVTIGGGFEAHIGKLTSMGAVAAATILDAVGSVAAEEAAIFVNKKIAEEAKKKGLKATRRFSPGYGNWPISDQPKILAFLGAEKIGLSCNAANIMQPRKSVTALFGLR